MTNLLGWCHIKKRFLFPQFFYTLKKTDSVSTVFLHPATASPICPPICPQHHLLGRRFLCFLFAGFFIRDAPPAIADVFEQAPSPPTNRTHASPHPNEPDANLSPCSTLLPAVPPTRFTPCTGALCPSRSFPCAQVGEITSAALKRASLALGFAAALGDREHAAPGRTASARSDAAGWGGKRVRRQPAETQIVNASSSQTGWGPCNSHTFLRSSSLTSAVARSDGQEFAGSAWEGAAPLVPGDSPAHVALAAGRRGPFSPTPHHPDQGRRFLDTTSVPTGQRDVSG